MAIRDHDLTATSSVEPGASVDSILYGEPDPARASVESLAAGELAAELTVPQQMILHCFSLGGPFPDETVWIAEELRESGLLASTHVTTHDLAIVNNAMADLRRQELIEPGANVDPGSNVEADLADANRWQLTAWGSRVAVACADQLELR